MLLKYPYGCIEQITSSIVPHIAVKHIHDALKIPYDLKVETIKYMDSEGNWRDRTIADTLADYIVKTMEYRVISGGFSYWTGEKVADFEMTAYAVRTLAKVRDL